MRFMFSKLNVGFVGGAWKSVVVVSSSSSSSSSSYRGHVVHHEEFEKILRLPVMEVRLGLIDSVEGSFCRFSRNMEAFRVRGSRIAASEIAKAVAIRRLRKSAEV